MKIVTYNVNGIRAALKKGLADWIKKENADIICLQEVKAEENQFEKSIFEEMGYTCHIFPAVKKGYSGVAILSKVKELSKKIGMGIAKYDDEGRVLQLDFPNYSVLSVYMPSGTSGEERQAFKYEWLDDFFGYIHDLRKERPNLIVCGDYNICHKPIDIHNPVSNKNSSGFLPEERAWMEKFFTSGFVDSFRQFNESPHQYTWWSYRAGSRAKNLGWRIDYQSVTDPLKSMLQKSWIDPTAEHSDHCPVLLEIE